MTSSQQISLSSWQKLGHYASNAADDAAALFEKGNVAANTKDFVIEPITRIFQGAKHAFGCPTDKHVETLDTINAGLAIPSFLSLLADLRTKIQGVKRSDDPLLKRKLVETSLLATVSGTESALFLDTIKIRPLNEMLNGVKGAFWGSLLLFSGMNIFEGISNAETLDAAWSKAHASQKSFEKKEIIQHRIRCNFLTIAKHVTTVAMAAIALVSIFFASIAQGVLFSPLTFFALSTSWVVLNFTTYFYEKMIDRWEGNYHSSPHESFVNHSRFA